VRKLNCLGVAIADCSCAQQDVKEHRLRVFEIGVLRGIFGPKGDGVTGEWRRLHNEELNDLY
jgi:hypothetical protein